MVRAVGIDPGTKTFELCGIEDGEVFHEKILQTADLAEEPHLLIEAIEKVMPLDLIVAPSGYGVEVTRLDEIPEEKLKEWYLTYILLLKEKDLDKALSGEETGIMVYSTMVQNALEMKRREWPICYIPGVINLSTVPEWRKINNLDMGTVDKLCSSLLGIHDQAVRKDISYDRTSFLLIEMGFGYNSTLAVENGKIVDGLGGTTGGIGFLSAGKLDLELVQLVGGWDKSDVFKGGASTITGKDDPKAMIGDETNEVAWNAMMEGIEKSAASLLTSVSDPEEILLSGRLNRMKEVREELEYRLGEFGPIRTLGSLSGAEKIKEAAQGSAIAAEGLAGGDFSQLVEHIELIEAEGTALDHLYHPKGLSVKEELEKKVSFRP